MTTNITRSEKFKDLYNVIQSNPVVKQGKFVEYLKKSKAFMNNGGTVVDDTVIYDSEIGPVNDYFALAEYLETDLLAIKMLITGSIDTVDGRNNYRKRELTGHDNWDRFDYVHALAHLESNPEATFNTLVNFCNKTVEITLN